MTNSFDSFPAGNRVRASDAERQDAINLLATAVGEGRLSIEEFEERADRVMRTTTQQELAAIFRDIPVRAEVEPKEFSRAELERARQAGRRPRLATALIGSGALNFAGVALLVAGDGSGSLLALLAGLGAFTLIPILWILLYVAKIGPDSWHVPSPRQIERQQIRELRALTARQRAEQKQLESEMWAQRRLQAGELTGEALDLAKRTIDRMHRR
ncbi:hypothetical protein CPHO_11170 [Corynebacterium phocae]|uniref:DUF1707 domain-containing protein n=1 Tax=Corynebacterium phocae TaxID=161895 RepID=A0A1L7D5B0_9CORY|nr:DUF1707 domain-containing protein [Corynebacterium phocae]APT93356.1 hypothetical protein CPHO_11170 [Corynebacterium phocae]KAA8721694.1 DUF1707 domain-containing protein [Corynebacterium phocae]